MAKTIQQIQDLIDQQTLDARQLINLIVDYLQDNPGGSGGGVESVTYAELIDLIEGNDLTVGTFYKITNRGDRGLIFQAVSTNELAEDGTRLMLCPAYYKPRGNGTGTITYSSLQFGTFEPGDILGTDGNEEAVVVQDNGDGTLDVTDVLGDWSAIEHFYDLTSGAVADLDSYSYVGKTWIGVWHSTKTAAINDLAIWGGLVWKNLTGSIGTADSTTELDGTNWQLISKASYSNNEYTQMVFGCSYDVENDWISKQWDSNGNIFGSDYKTVTQALSYTFNPVDVSDWNYASAVVFYDNTIHGVWNNTVTQVGISQNKNGGGIYGNKCSGIYQNYNSGPIVNNTSSSQIYNNYNAGAIEGNTCLTIWANYNAGAISSNSNTGNIVQNWNLGDISGNSNSGDIEANMNIGAISTNSNVGDIEYNNNNGQINSNSSGAIACNIFNNTNNGSISGTWSGDVNDVIVNKT